MAVIDPNLTVLVVDDLRQMRRMLREMLRLMGFRHILEAEDGDVALQKLHGQQVDLILSDWAMPRLSGLRLLKAVREDDRLARIPFLMVSEEMKEAEVAAAGEERVDAYILKPFTAQMLLFAKSFLMWLRILAAKGINSSLFHQFSCLSRISSQLEPRAESASSFASARSLCSK